jgi:hypothetical protein
MLLRSQRNEQKIYIKVWSVVGGDRCFARPNALLVLFDPLQSLQLELLFELVLLLLLDFR